MSTVKITLNKPSIYECEGVIIIAGENTFESAEVKKLLANPLVQADIESGILTVVHESAAVKDEPKRQAKAAK